MIFWILLGMAAAVLLVSFATYMLCFFSPHKGQNDIYNYPSAEQYLPYREGAIRMIRAMAEVPCEIVAVRSREGLRLTGRYYAQSDTAPLAICFHGYRAVGLRDFCGGSRAILDRGMDLLLVNQGVDSSMIADAEEMQLRQKLADLLKYGAVVVTTLPVLAIYPFIQKYFVKGVMVGAVKG